MGKSTGFLEFERRVSQAEEPLQRIRHFTSLRFTSSNDTSSRLSRAYKSFFSSSTKAVPPDIPAAKLFPVAPRITTQPIIPHDYKRVQDLINEYKSKGLSHEQAEVVAFNQMRGEGSHGKELLGMHQAFLITIFNNRPLIFLYRHTCPVQRTRWSRKVFAFSIITVCTQRNRRHRCVGNMMQCY